MRKLNQKFMALSTRRQFIVLFVSTFLIGLLVVPFSLHDPRRILPEWSGWQFVLFAVLVCAANAALLAACGVYGGQWLARRRA
jgi:hypothetical protein